MRSVDELVMVKLGVGKIANSCTLSWWLTVTLNDVPGPLYSEQSTTMVMLPTELWAAAEAASQALLLTGSNRATAAARAPARAASVTSMKRSAAMPAQATRKTTPNSIGKTITNSTSA